MVVIIENGRPTSSGKIFNFVFLQTQKLGAIDHLVFVVSLVVSGLPIADPLSGTPSIIEHEFECYILSRSLTLAISFYFPFYPFPDSRRLGPKRFLETFLDIVEKFNSCSYMRWAVESIIHSFQNAKTFKIFCL